MILVEVIPKGCDLSHYCEFLFSFSLCSGFLWGGGESKGKLWEGLFSSHFVPSFFFLFLFGWCSLGQVNPRLIQAIHQASHLSSQLKNGGWGGEMHMYE
jgi:hypothetical protein